MNCKEVNDAIERVYQRLSALSKEEFRQLMDEHKGGDVERILLETGALECD